jgi:hypothetical protein
MTLSRSAKIIVGVLTGAVVLLPVGFIVLAVVMMLGWWCGSPRDFPLPSLGPFAELSFPLMCLVNVLVYGMVAFYVAHAIKNQAASDTVRIIGILLIFIAPYLGMPAYYVVYILLATPPAWAMKRVEETSPGV